MIYSLPVDKTPPRKRLKQICELSKHFLWWDSYRKKSRFVLDCAPHSVLIEIFSAYGNVYGYFPLASHYALMSKIDILLAMFI